MWKREFPSLQSGAYELFWGLFALLWDARTAMWKILPERFFPQQSDLLIMKAKGRLGTGDEGWGWKLQLKCQEVPWIPTCLRPLQSSAQLLPTSTCNLSSLQKQTCSHKTAVILWCERRNVQPASCCSSEKTAATFCTALGFFSFFFFFTFKIKNLPKKA